MKKHKISVSIPKNIIVGYRADVLGFSFIFSVLGSPQEYSQLFVSSSKNVFFYIDPLLSEGLGGFIFIHSSSSTVAEMLSSDLSRLVNSLA